jgi:hypothetical protein
MSARRADRVADGRALDDFAALKWPQSATSSAARAFRSIGSIAAPPALSRRS